MRTDLGPSSPLGVLDRIGWWGALVMIAIALVYTLFMLLSSRGAPKHGGPSHPDAPLLIVILMPCLNEAEVIGASVRRLTSIPDPGLRIMVIDDGSDDDTAQAAARAGDERVEVVRRQPPRARLGKGEALNDALSIVRSRCTSVSSSRVVVGVMDADGRLDPHAIGEVRKAFAPQEVGAVQMGVRINNRFGSLLARMQDMEFVIFTEVFQRGRRRVRSVGMGGNAQFVRLSALDALGPRPWTRSLTEDFDLGIRLNATSWTNEFWPSASVHQQGVTNMRRLVRQRTRWFQGNLQALHLLRSVAREQRGLGRADTLWQILTPYLLLTGSLLTLSFLISMATAGVAAVLRWEQSWMWLVGAYVIAFGPALIYAWIYWRIERSEGLGLIRAVAYSHLFVLYGLLPSLYGWRAVARELTGRTGWAKTAREAEPDQAAQAQPSHTAAVTGPGGQVPAGSPVPGNLPPPDGRAREAPLTAPRAGGAGIPIPTGSSPNDLNDTAIIGRSTHRAASNLTNEETR
ncbi:glycosyltransferase family 2 protein [Actinomyces sp. ZJ308]|uniref:glycosyltransferase family 2 protein n=1 Tax=Actinomyces sp. ZJ308 TaxID=2708342 RepID=UPI001FBA8F27|nr:glycosyltransferase family 2 protein [Actinomyces sp. ZJ308]